MTLLLRFIFGVILAGGLLLLAGYIPLWASAIFVMTIGIMATIWGDRFLLGLMALFRYLR